MKTINEVRDELLKNPPIKLTDDSLPKFPIDALPGVLRDYTHACAESLQVPEDMTAVCGLAVCSLAVQHKFKITGKPGWQEPLNIYATEIALPAERKSAVIALLTRPVFDYEQEQNKKLQGVLDKYQIEHDILVKKIKGLEDAAARPDAKLELLDIVLAKKQELSEMEAKQPKLIRLWTDDATPEAMTSLLAEQEGRLGIISAEGGLFDLLAGRYSNSVNIDVILKAHTGDSVRVDRKGRPSEYINRPAMTIFLAIQPQVLDGIMGNETFRGRGLTARFLYSIPTSKIGTRSFDTTEIPSFIADEYSRLVTRLLNIHQFPCESNLTLSADATEALRAYHNELEPRLAEELKSIGDWAGKLLGAVLRIAGILHIIQYENNSTFRSVSQETLLNAIAIGRYFLEHAKAAYNLMGADKTLADGEFIIKKLMKKPLLEVSKRDLYIMCRPRFETPDDLDDPLQLLEANHYIASVPTEYKGTGQPPSPKYCVNPKLYVQNEQNEH